jgi:hypothetical protein
MTSGHAKGTGYVYVNNVVHAQHLCVLDIETVLLSITKLYSTDELAKLVLQGILIKYF